MRRRCERPEIRPEHHDAKRNIHIVVVLFHTLFELISEIFGQADIYGVLGSALCGPYQKGKINL